MHRALITTAAIAAAACSAAASPLSDFNLIVFGDHQSGSNVWGRVAVGGNMAGNAIDVGTRLTPSGDFVGQDALIVGGNINAGINLQAGDLRHGGTRNGHLNLNGGGPSVQSVFQDASAASIVAGMETEVRNFSSQLWSQTTNSTAAMGNLSNRYTLTTGATTTGATAVFSLDAAVFSSHQWAQITLDNAAGAETIIINVDASSTGGNVSFNAGNIDANTFADYSANIVWNFFNATNIMVQRELFGSMIGADAHLTNFTNLNGSIAVGSMTQNGEVHGPNFARNVPIIPLPTTAALGALGLGMIATRRRRA
ncbi:MAG: choice-of-anchor A family protein [Phycisphaerales bacterium]|nr:MAG: choice-of-anchor A family protein [Phycisphaerales bacterium]